GGVYKVWQHLPLNVAASALMHPKGTGETNHNNAIQIEHVGTAATSVTWSPDYLDGIAKLCRWIEDAVGVPRQCRVGFASGPASRLTWEQWNAYSGHLGHQHVPFNDHTDPGSIAIAVILGGGAAAAVQPIVDAGPPTWTT